MIPETERISDEKLRDIIEFLEGDYPLGYHVTDPKKVLLPALRELVRLREGWVSVTNGRDSDPGPGWWGLVVWYDPNEAEKTLYQGMGSYSYHGGWYIDEDPAERVVVAWHNPLPMPVMEKQGVVSEKFETDLGKIEENQ